MVEITFLIFPHEFPIRAHSYRTVETWCGFYGNLIAIDQFTRIFPRILRFTQHEYRSTINFVIQNVETNAGY